MGFSWRESCVWLRAARRRDSLKKEWEPGSEFSLGVISELTKMQLS